MVNVEGQCKLPGYSNPKKHWQNLKDDLQLLKNWINFPFAASLVVLRSALEWKSWLTKLWSENIFHHVIFTRHSYDQSTSRTNRPTTCYRRKLGLHSPWHWYSSVMFHYQAELITTFCLQYFQGVFFSGFCNIKKNIWSSVSFSNPPKVLFNLSWEPKIWELRTTPVKYHAFLRCFWSLIPITKQGSCLIVTSCRFKI